VLGSLNIFFGTTGLRREHLNAVFQHFGLMVGYRRSESEDSEPALLQVDCLRKIRRADEVIHVCEQALKPLANGLPLSAISRDWLGRILLEMHTLMKQRLYFGSQETYLAVSRVEADLEQLLALPPRDESAISVFWRNRLEPDIRHAVVQLFGELEKLRELAGVSSFRESTVG